MQKQLDTILKKEMTRKEFLATMGLGLASVLGFSSLLQMLSGRGMDRGAVTEGYGSSAYGGAARSDRVT